MTTATRTTTLHYDEDDEEVLESTVKDVLMVLGSSDVLYARFVLFTIKTDSPLTHLGDSHHKPHKTLRPT